MREDIVQRTGEFLKAKLWEAKGFEGIIPRMIEYRIEHSYRVANIALEIAEKEGLDRERMYVTALLHDVGYSKEFHEHQEYREHGRVGAAIARPFLLELGYGEAEVNEMCYAIAIHVDDKADFEGERNAFTLTVQDADNIDRFDAFRLYEGLANADYRNMPIAEQQAFVEKMLRGLTGLREEPFGTPTSTAMWKEKIDFQLEMYKRLQHQIKISE